jgi:hypothetical protein
MRGPGASRGCGAAAVTSEGASSCLAEPSPRVMFGKSLGRSLAGARCESENDGRTVHVPRRRLLMDDLAAYVSPNTGGCRVVAYDRPPYGLSQRPLSWQREEDNPYTVEGGESQRTLVELHDWTSVCFRKELSNAVLQSYRHLCLKRYDLKCRLRVTAGFLVVKKAV